MQTPLLRCPSELVANHNFLWPSISSQIKWLRWRWLCQHACRATESDLLAEPCTVSCAMPVDFEQLHKAEHRTWRSWQRAPCVRRQLLKLTVRVVAFLVLTGWMWLTSRGSGHNHVSSSVHRSHRLSVRLVHVRCRDFHWLCTWVLTEGKLSGSMQTCSCSHCMS